MSKKSKFIEEVTEMMEKTQWEWKDEEARTYWLALISTKENDKPEFTDNGKMVILYMQENSVDEGTMFSAKSIGEGLLCSSKTVSGALRKLVSDGYVEKAGQDPVIYVLTEKGKTKKVI